MNDHQKCCVPQNKALPVSSPAWLFSGFFLYKDDMSKPKVDARQICGCLAENFEESGQGDRKGCD